ncbi:MAG: TVP38/TMEM64 family protein [Chitinivibrionales bacterium]
MRGTTHTCTVVKRASALLVFILTVSMATVWAGRLVSLKKLAAHERELRELIEGNQVIAVMLGVLAYTVLSLIPGTSGKSVVAGWLFGHRLGIPLVLSGLTLAAMLIFFVSRYGLRDMVENRIGKYLRRLNQRLETEGAFYLLAVRMAHAPFSIVNWASGASRIRPWTFAWTTVTGLLPGTCVFVHAGTQLPMLHELIDSGLERLVEPQLLLALALSGLLPLVSKWLFNLWRSRRCACGEHGATGTAAEKGAII